MITNFKNNLYILGSYMIINEMISNITKKKTCYDLILEQV